MYDISASLRENTDLLAAPLDATEPAAYGSLRARLDSSVNRPKIVSVSANPPESFDLSLS